MTGHYLDVFRNADVGHATLSIGGNTAMSTTFNGMCRPHDALIEYGYVHIQFVEIDILLVVHADKVMEDHCVITQHSLS